MRTLQWEKEYMFDFLAGALGRLACMPMLLGEEGRMGEWGLFSQRSEGSWPWFTPLIVVLGTWRQGCCLVSLIYAAKP